MGDFSEKVFEVVAQIPRGKVVSYGQVARMIGSPRSARYVGYALRSNSSPGVIPCHRVVFKDGRICEGYAFGGPEVQRGLLEDEGVLFVGAMTVDMQACCWCPDEDSLTLSGEVNQRRRPINIDWDIEMGE